MRCCWILLAACAASRPPQPAPVERARTEPAVAVAPAHDPPPSEVECDALFTHALGIAIAALPRAPVDADRETVRGELRAAFVADCRAGTRAYHECGLAAKSVGELVACRDRQRTPSSSTSKRSVELGGMTLPKPRAP